MTDWVTFRRTHSQSLQKCLTVSALMTLMAPAIIMAIISCTIRIFTLSPNTARDQETRSPNIFIFFSNCGTAQTVIM